MSAGTRTVARNGAGTRTGAGSRTADTAVRGAARGAVRTGTQPRVYGRVNSASLFRWIVLGAMSAAVLAVLVISCAQSHELTRNIRTKEAELKTAQQEYDAMLDKFNATMNDSYVEEYAKELGLQKREASQTEYVTLEGGDVFEFDAQAD